MNLSFKHQPGTPGFTNYQIRQFSVLINTPAEGVAPDSTHMPLFSELLERKRPVSCISVFPAYHYRKPIGGTLEMFVHQMSWLLCISSTPQDVWRAPGGDEQNPASLVTQSGGFLPCSNISRSLWCRTSSLRFPTATAALQRREGGNLCPELESLPGHDELCSRANGRRGTRTERHGGMGLQKLHVAYMKNLTLYEELSSFFSHEAKISQVLYPTACHTFFQSIRVRWSFHRFTEK